MAAQQPGGAAAAVPHPVSLRETVPPHEGEGGLKIEGYASLWWAKDLGGDVVARGAFADSLRRRPAGEVAMLWRHAADAAVGVWDELREDAKGLFVRGRVTAPHAAALVKSGAVEGLSIGYRTARARRGDGGRVRVLSAVDLREVSLVAFPMLPGARVRAAGEAVA